MIDESQYNLQIAAVFHTLMKASDNIDPDILESSTSGDMVALTAASGQKCIVSTQRAVRQIWVAGKGLGIHFSFDEASQNWKDDKHQGLELYQFIQDVVKTISGTSLPL
jgi:CyaY protein